jgi:hypothetical protein
MTAKAAIKTADEARSKEGRNNGCTRIYRDKDRSSTEENPKSQRESFLSGY